MVCPVSFALLLVIALKPTEHLHTINMWWKIGPPLPRFSDAESICIRQWNVEINASHRARWGIGFGTIKIIELHGGCEHWLGCDRAWTCGFVN